MSAAKGHLPWSIGRAEKNTSAEGMKLQIAFRLPRRQLSSVAQNTKVSHGTMCLDSQSRKRRPVRLVIHLSRTSFAATREAELRNQVHTVSRRRSRICLLRWVLVFEPLEDGASLKPYRRRQGGLFHTYLTREPCFKANESNVCSINAFSVPCSLPFT